MVMLVTGLVEGGFLNLLLDIVNVIEVVISEEKPDILRIS